MGDFGPQAFSLETRAFVRFGEYSETESVKEPVTNPETKPSLSETPGKFDMHISDGSEEIHSVTKTKGSAATFFAGLVRTVMRCAQNCFSRLSNISFIKSSGDPMRGIRYQRLDKVKDTASVGLEATDRLQQEDDGFNEITLNQTKKKVSVLKRIWGDFKRGIPGNGENRPKRVE